MNIYKQNDIRQHNKGRYKSKLRGDIWRKIRNNLRSELSKLNVHMLPGLCAAKCGQRFVDVDGSLSVFRMLRQQVV